MILGRLAPDGVYMQAPIGATRGVDQKNFVIQIHSEIWLRLLSSMLHILLLLQDLTVRTIAGEQRRS